VFQVRIQDEASFRDTSSDILNLHVRNRAGSLVPLRSLVTLSTSFGPNVVNRYNLFPSAAINGQAAPGFSTGQALLAMEDLARSTLPNGYGTEWTGLALQERQAGGQLAIVTSLAVVFAFLFLVAQYESWSIPLAVMLSVSVATLGALVSVLLARLDLNIYVQIGLVLLVGLAAKNAILIVEFAKQQRDRGRDIIDAAKEGTRERFRPVMMTAFAFVLGVVPMVVATGAGAGSRRSLGTTVFGGMLAGTLLGLLLSPLLYVLVQSARERLKARFQGRGNRGSLGRPSHGQ
jgi:multidrug efflux pump subunit AcrB